MINNPSSIQEPSKRARKGPQSPTFSVGDRPRIRGEECQTNPILRVSSLKTRIAPKNKANSKPISPRPAGPHPAGLAAHTVRSSRTQSGPQGTQTGPTKCQTKPIFRISGPKTPVAPKNKPNSKPISTPLTRLGRLGPTIARRPPAVYIRRYCRSMAQCHAISEKGAPTVAAKPNAIVAQAQILGGNRPAPVRPLRTQAAQDPTPGASLRTPTTKGKG
jgi:hypothetical protein